MFKRPISRQLARELKPAEVDQVSGGDNGVEIGEGHMTYTGKDTYDASGRAIDFEAIHDPG